MLEEKEKGWGGKNRFPAWHFIVIPGRAQREPGIQSDIARQEFFAPGFRIGAYAPSGMTTFKFNRAI
jgi:hypothetical protein